MKLTVQSSIWLLYLIPASLDWTDKEFSLLFLTIWLTNHVEIWEWGTEWVNDWPKQRPGQFVKTNLSITKIRLAQPTSVWAPVSAPGQWKVTNWWHRLWRTKLQTGNSNNLEGWSSTLTSPFPTLALISLLSESPEIKELKMIVTLCTTNQLAKIVSRILTKWSPCSDSRMLDVWKISGWTGDSSPQRSSSSSQLPSEPGPWLTTTRSPGNNFLHIFFQKINSSNLPESHYLPDDLNKLILLWMLAD